ncbi:hypothetical protein SAMN05880570_2120 [Paenibacillus sp. RU4T]|nr:hypothetical protein SAMN05880555_2121 [Paenibacillus sp. RU4X]SIQ93738.1 hypothetical protein SAMN05880570_2120 [Paenibacillus sp. RU4T]
MSSILKVISATGTPLRRASLYTSELNDSGTSSRFETFLKGINRFGL